MAQYARDGHYDIDLASSGGGWMGTFRTTVRNTASDILGDGQPYGPVEVTLDDPVQILTGTLTGVADNALLVIVDGEPRPQFITLDEVVRFRA